MFQYRLSKSTIASSRYLGPLLVYVRGTEGQEEWYSQSVLYTPSSSGMHVCTTTLDTQSVYAATSTYAAAVNRGS